MIIETFNAVDDNGNLYHVSIDQEYTVIRDRSGKTEVPGMKRAFDSLGRRISGRSRRPACGSAVLKNNNRRHRRRWRRCRR